MRSIDSTLAYVLAVPLIVSLAGACALRDRDGHEGPSVRTDAPVQGVACAVPGGVCPAGSLCIHVCDCCGHVPDGGAGMDPASHDPCVPDTNQCDSTLFTFESSVCSCSGPGEASCPCA